MKANHQYPRFHSHFSCRTYRPSFKFPSRLQTEGVLQTAAGSHSSPFRKAVTLEHGPVIIKRERLNSCEIMFYEQVTGLASSSFPPTAIKEEDRNVLMQLYVHHMPRFYGSFSCGSLNCAVIEDLASRFIEPATLDISIQQRKFGLRSYYVPKGLRNTFLEGRFKVSIQLEFFSFRDAWSNITEDQVEHCVRAAFLGGETMLTSVIKDSLLEVQQMYDLLERQRSIFFEDTSILILHETSSRGISSQTLHENQGHDDNKVDGEDIDDEQVHIQLPKQVDVKLIDFDEATPEWGLVHLHQDDSIEQRLKHTQIPLKKFLQTLKKLLHESQRKEKFPLSYIQQQCPTLIVQRTKHPK